MLNCYFNIMVFPLYRTHTHATHSLCPIRCFKENQGEISSDNDNMKLKLHFINYDKMYASELILTLTRFILPILIRNGKTNFLVGEYARNEGSIVWCCDTPINSNYEKWMNLYSESIERFYSVHKLLMFHFIWDIDIRDNNSKCR